MKASKMWCPICGSSLTQWCRHKSGKYEMWYGWYDAWRGESMYKTYVYIGNKQLLVFTELVKLDQDRIEKLLVLA
jgi:hypothetical protein